MTDPPRYNPPSSNAPRTLRPGDKVDPFTIHSQIGSGGSSIVFKATDELLGRTVAIKQFLFTPGPDDEPLREKIRTEAKLHKDAAAANPDRLVQVIDVVDGPHGLLLISEYIDGPSLEQILAKNTQPMDPKQALGIVAATALALQAIHDQGIVHRDLKPANILMPRTGGLKISDFGLAVNTTDQTPPTAGTARYMAPELLRGEKIDGRADLYALGMLAYEMLAGREKFDQAFKLVLRDQRNQAMRWMKWHTNARTKATPLNDLVPGVSPSLVELVERMMHKDPAKRIGSAGELLHAIKQHFGSKGQPVVQADEQTPEAAPIEPTTPGDTTALPPRSRAGKYGIIAAVTCVLIAATVGLVLWQQSRSARAQEIAGVRQILNEAGDAYKDGRYTESLLRFQKVIDTWPADSGLGRHARAGALLAQGQIDADAGRYDQALLAFKQVSKLGEGYQDRARLLIQDTRQARAFAQTLQKIESMIADHDYGEARKELDAWRDLTATDDEQQTLRALGAKLEDQLSRWRVQKLIAQAHKLTTQGKRGEAIALLKDAPQKLGVTTLLATLQADAAYDTAVALGGQAQAKGQLPEAISQYKLALQAKGNDALKEKLADLQSQWLLQEGLKMLAQGDTAEADRLLTEALGHQPDNPQAREALARIASSNRREAFIRAGDAAAVRRDFETALKQYENALMLGVDDALMAKMATAQVQIKLARSREALLAGRIDEATDLVNQAKQLVQDSPDVAAVLQEVQVRGAYLRHLRGGDEARARSAFGEAKRHYIRARDAMDTPQIRARLDETEYDHILAQARDFIAASEYPSAKALLQVAANIRMTDEIQKLMDLVSTEAPSTREPSP